MPIALREKPAQPLVLLRAAVPDDAAVIHAMTQAAYAEYANTDAPSSVARESAEGVRAALERGEFQALIAYADGAPAGSVRYRTDDTGLYFFRLGVVPEARGRGVARCLVERLEAVALVDGAERLYCRVRMNVPRNVALYETSGFRAVGTGETIQRGETVIPLGVMEKVL